MKFNFPSVSPLRQRFLPLPTLFSSLTAAWFDCAFAQNLQPLRGRAEGPGGFDASVRTARVLLAGPTPSPSSWLWRGARANIGARRGDAELHGLHALPRLASSLSHSSCQIKRGAEAFVACSRKVHQFSGLGWLWKCCDSTVCHLPSSAGRPSKDTHVNDGCDDGVHACSRFC